jgi:hypothetical protein
MHRKSRYSDQNQIAEKIVLFWRVIPVHNADMKDATNPHMWIPYRGPEPYDEVCALCGVFSGASQEA